jgi:hypothetical protein
MGANIQVLWVPEQARQQEPPYELIQGLLGTARVVNLVSVHSVGRSELLSAACPVPQPDLLACGRDACSSAKSATVAATNAVNEEPDTVY